MLDPRWSLETVTPPASPDDLPVSVADARRQCRVGHTDDDALLLRLVKAADELAATWAGAVLCPRTVKAAYEGFPHDTGGGGGLPLRLPRGPCRAVSSVKYYAADGTLTTLAAGTDYQVWLAHNPPFVAPAPQKYWPPTQYGRLAAVEVEYAAGYATSADIPAAVQQAVLVLVAFNYENPQGFEKTGKVSVPPAAQGLLMSAGLFGYA